MNTFNLTLDNLTYNIVVNSTEDLKFILPIKTPNIDLTAKEGENSIASANEITIKAYIRTKLSKDAEKIPAIEIVGQDENNQDIITSGYFQLTPEDPSLRDLSFLKIIFSTIDGGRTWLVNSNNVTSEIAEDAETVAKNAYTYASNNNKLIVTITNDTIPTLEAKVDKNKKELQDEIDTLETKKVDVNTKAIEDINTELEAVNENISNLKSADSTIMNRINSIDGKASENTSNISQLKTTVETNTENITNINENITNINTELDKKATSTALSDLETKKVDVNTNSITGLNTDINNLEVQFDTLKDTTVPGIATRVDTLETNMAKLSDYSVLKSNVNTLTQQLTALTERVTALENASKQS